jgi:hypothetical protein
MSIGSQKRVKPRVLFLGRKDGKLLTTPIETS